MVGGNPIVQSMKELQPAPELRGHVACVWVHEVGPGSGTFTHRRAPNGSVEIVCALGSMPRILGPQTGPVEQVLGPGTTLVGVRLRPEAASCVLGTPAAAVCDGDLGVDELWGDRGRTLQDRLPGARSSWEAVMILERMVADRLTDAADLDPMVTEAVSRLRSGTATGVAASASSLFISERQFRRRCEAAVGLSPKMLQRILRFQRLLAWAWTLERPSTQLAWLAHQAGYADQAHLTREAARLEGRSPRTFLQESEQRCGCGHDHGASYGPLLTPARPRAA